MSHPIENAHISSLVVHCLPKKLATIKAEISQIEQVDVAAHDALGKLVLVLETETEKEILLIIDHINGLSGVLTTTMVYHELDC